MVVRQDSQAAASTRLPGLVLSEDSARLTSHTSISHFQPLPLLSPNPFPLSRAAPIPHSTQSIDSVSFCHKQSIIFCFCWQLLLYTPRPLPSYFIVFILPRPPGDVNQNMILPSDYHTCISEPPTCIRIINKSKTLKINFSSIL